MEKPTVCFLKPHVSLSILHNGSKDFSTLKIIVYKKRPTSVLFFNILDFKVLVMFTIFFNA